MNSSRITEEELDATLVPSLEKLRQVWQKMGMSERECIERELAVLEQVATLLAKMETEEKALLLSVSNDVEIMKRKTELLQSELRLENQKFTVDKTLTLIDSAKYYNELLNLLEEEKFKRMELYGKLEDKLVSVCSRLGEAHEKLGAPKVPSISEINELADRVKSKIVLFASRQQVFSNCLTQAKKICKWLHYVPENNAHRDLLFDYPKVVLSKQSVTEVKHFYDEMKIKYEEHLKRNEKMHHEQLLRLHKCWDNCKIRCSDRIAFLNSTSDKSESEVEQIFEDEIERLNHYYAQRKDIFDQVDRWIALWKKKVDMEGNIFHKHRERTNESIDHSSLGQQLMEMQLDIKSSAEAWRRRNPGQMLLYEGESIEDRIALIETNKENCDGMEDKKLNYS